ncbi:N-acetyltransferase family protein [Falsibacillus pallidus]|uniref:GNAT family N-acetyltransferase n=1 Tax=Falsibacillus pallidus TaxID=493781 RepID=UPI003D95B6D2
MLIRKARLEDAMQIAEVHVESWRQSYKGIVNDSYLKSLKVEPRFKLWSQVLQNDHSVYVAESEGRVSGFASFGKERSGEFDVDGELYAIYLLDSIKRKGAGTELLSIGVEDLLQRGFHSMSVWVLKENPSIKFYESFNLIKLGEEEIEIGGEKFVEMCYGWKSLKTLHELIQARIK